jgi:general secretion pathway protein D
VAIVGLGLLAGCAANDESASIDLGTQMRVPIDYYAHQTVNPPRKAPSGPVLPADPAPGRERNFGPESRLVPARTDHLEAALAAFRKSEPHGARDLVALAKQKKKYAAKTPHADRWLGAAAEPATETGRSLEGIDERPSVENKEEGYRLNFEDVDVKDVLQAVLGKVLGLNYTIAPNVIGRITISSAAPQSRSELLSTMETVLASQGLSLTKVGGLYRVAPMTVGAGTLDKTGAEAGFGISVVPVQFVSVASVSKLLSGFVVEADGIRIDTSQNAVIVRGPGPRREEIVRAIKAFDGDWMHQQSVSVFELRRSRPEEVIGELTRIFDADTNGGSGGVIQFKAMRRLRSIMVISRNEQLVHRAAAWIHRLDHQDLSATSSVFVYRPRYRDAKELAKMVNSLFGQDQSDGGDDETKQGAQGQPGQFGQSGQSGQNGQASQSGAIGASTASFAGSLGLPTGSGGGQGGLGLASASPGQGQGGGNALGGRNGLQGNLANPIDAGLNQGQDRVHLSLKADSSNNTIVAYTDGDTYTKVHSVLQQLDLPPLQVAINVVVAEVDLNDELQYGIQFFLNKSKIGSLSLSQTASTVLSTQTGFNLLIGSASTPDVVITALDSISKVHILSTPSVVVMENKPATFEVGNQVPVITQQSTSTITANAPTVNSVQYVDTGIILKITPRVGQNGDVAMTLDQVISSVVNNSSSATSLTPTISKRRVASDISVKSGQTVMLAGLISDTRSQTKSQIPFLGPFSNVLGNKDNVFTRNELVVFIHPVIIRNGQDAVGVAEDMKAHLHALNISPPPVHK